MTLRQLRLIDAAYAGYLWSLVALGFLARWYALYRAGELDPRPLSRQGLLFFAATATGLLTAFGASMVGWGLALRGFRATGEKGVAALARAFFRGVPDRGLLALAVAYFFGVAPAILLLRVWGAWPLLVTGPAFALLILWLAGRWFLRERRRALAAVRARSG